MGWGNQNSNLGSLFAEHTVFALKTQQNTSTSTIQTSQLPPDSHEATFF